MAILKKIFPLLPAVIFTSCYEDFNPNIEITPVLCINSLITAGQPIKVNVSRTWIYTDENEANREVDDAVVSLYVNGDRVEASYIPREGDNITIEVESRKYGRAEASVTVPHAVVIDAATCTPEVLFGAVYDHSEYQTPLDGFLRFNLDVILTFKDDPSVRNYYRFASSSQQPESFGGIDEDNDELMENFLSVNFSPGFLDPAIEPIFSEHIGALEAVSGGENYDFTFFTDRQIQGKDYTLHLRYENANYWVQADSWNPDYFDCELILELNTISESYYNWGSYLWQYEDGLLVGLGELGLGDPVWAYSNVSTGAGVVAARSVATYTIKLKDFLEKTMHELHQEKLRNATKS